MSHQQGRSGLFSFRAHVGSVVLACAAMHAPGQLEADFQFRINAALTRQGVWLNPPTIGLVRSGTNVGGNTTDSMAFSWSDEGLEAVALPICFETCGSFIVDEIFASGDLAEIERLYMRRFTHDGTPIDLNDIVLSETIMPPNHAHGGFFTPSLAISPVIGSVIGNPMHLVWWEMWSWMVNPFPCGTNSCHNQPVATWQLGWPAFNAPAPNTGSTAFHQPAFCRAHQPSVGVAHPLSRLVAWRQVDGGCRRILAHHNVAGLIVVRDPGPMFDVLRPCVDALPGGNAYVVAWVEVNRLSAFQTVYARRVYASGALGAVVTVSGPITVAAASGPAVCAFPDGSFAVQWVEDAPMTINPLYLKRYDANEPPVQYGPVIQVESATFSTRHTIACLGAGIAHPSNPHIHLASVYEHRLTPTTNLLISARAIDSATGQLGNRVFVPILPSEDSINRHLGEPSQHTALLRSDQRIAVAWYDEWEKNNYCTVRTLPLGSCSGGCDSIDFNNDGLFPDTQDIDDFLSVFGGGPCSNDPNCNDIDFNNDCLFPDTQDIDDFIRVFGGGSC